LASPGDDMGMPMPKLDDQNRITPLAAAMRPQALDEIVGQKHLLGEGMLLRRMVETRRYQSVIFWGPPGMGKTSIVRCLANETESAFRQLNATKATVKELRTLIAAANKALPDKRTFVFVDEIHRWNKAQQDVMLPVVEDGTIILFGATTEKPKFAVNSTLLSRCLIMEVKPLSKFDLLNLIKRVRQYYKDKGKGFTIDKEASLRLVNRCSGDARKVITALETCVEILTDDNHVAIEHIDVAIPDKHLVFDSTGNEHFDLAHCYQESIQHSDVDAAIYWLAKWIASGEDPAYICRRMLITAFEDCSGNPFAAPAAMAACYTTERTGLPECMIPMAQATVEMAMSRRNKAAYFAIKEALKDVNNNETIHVPPGLRAGTDGYVAAINKTYVRGWNRDWKSIMRRESPDDISQTVYAIGIEHSIGEFGMIAGPTPNLEEMLEISGEDNHRILQFQGGKQDILFRWQDGAWFKV
jgi:putative ATPase